MKKVSSKQLDAYTSLLFSLHTAKDELEQALGDYNDEIERRFVTDIEPLVENLDKVKGELKEMFEEIRDAAQEHFDGQSETWQEHDEKGQPYQQWISWFEEAADNIDGETEIECPQVDEPDLDFSDIENMPESPEDA
jgi:nicotinamidase-related amidase